jgi:hypothetical protein
MAAAAWTACTKKLVEKKWSPGASNSLWGFAVFAALFGVFLKKHCAECGFSMVRLWCFAW